MKGYRTTKGLCIALLLAISVGTGKAQDEEEKGVVELTIDNFDQEVGKHDISGVFFYAPWCGHCKKAKPSWQTAAKKLEDANVKLFNVNMDEAENKPLSSRFKITGFPTIKLFRKKDIENPITYSGGRTESDFVDFYSSFTKDPVSEVETIDLKASEKLQLYAFLDGKESSEFKALNEYCDSMRQEVSCFLVADTAQSATIDKDLEVTSPSVVLRRPGDGFSSTLSQVTAADLTAFVEKHFVPPFFNFDNMSQKYSTKVFGEALNIFITGPKSQEKSVQEWAQLLPEKFSGKVAPSVIYAEKKSRIGSFLGIETAKTSITLAVASVRDQSKKFILEKEGDAKSSEQFIQDVLDGKIKKYVKSAAPPKDNNNPVKVVVADTLDSFVNSGKHVLLEVYAPWCGHCKKLEPIYNEAAEALAEFDNIVFAKLDGTENDIPNESMTVQGFPSLFYIGPDGSVQNYEGGRSLEDLKGFITKKAGVTVEAAEPKDEEEEDVKYEL